MILESRESIWEAVKGNLLIIVLLVCLSFVSELGRVFDDEVHDLDEAVIGEPFELVLHSSGLWVDRNFAQKFLVCVKLKNFSGSEALVFVFCVESIEV